MEKFDYLFSWTRYYKSHDEKNSGTWNLIEDAIKSGEWIRVGWLLSTIGSEDSRIFYRHCCRHCR